MGITLVNATSVDSFGTTGTCNKPASVVAGDVLYALVYTDDSTVTATCPGWTQVVAGGGSTAAGAVLRRVLDGTEGSSFTFTGSGGDGDVYNICIAAFRGVNNTTPEDVAGTSNSGSGTGISATGVTTVTDGAHILVFINQSGSGGTFSTPTGFSFNSTVHQGDGTNSGVSNQIFDGTQTTHGATGNISSTGSGTGAWASFLVALRPAVASAFPATRARRHPLIPRKSPLPIHSSQPHILKRIIQPPAAKLGFAPRMVRSRRSHALRAPLKTRFVKSSLPRILQRLIQPPAAKLGFAVRRVASRHRLKNNPLTRFVKSSFKRPLWLIQPPAAKLGFAVTRIAKRHLLKNNPLTKFIRHPFQRPRWLIQPPTSALGVFRRELVHKANPLRLGKAWKIVKSSFNREQLLGPALLAFTPLKLKRPHRVVLRKPSKLIKSSFKKFWLIQPQPSALGIFLHEVVHKARPVSLGKAWKSIKSTFRRPPIAAGPALLAFPPPKLKKEHRLVLRKASALIKSSFKKMWLIQPPSAKLGFPPTKLTDRHRLVLRRPSAFIKSSFRKFWLIQPPAAKLGFPSTRLAVRHRLILQGARKLIKSTFRAPRKLLQPRSLGFPPTELAKRHLVRLLKQPSLIKSRFKRPLWLIQPPVAKLGFAVTRVAKSHSIRLLKPFGQIKSKFKRPTWLIQPPAAKLGFPPTRLAKRRLLRLLKPSRLIKSAFKRPTWLIQPPAAKLGMVVRLLIHRQRLVRFARPFQTIKSLFKRPEREVQPFLPAFLRIISKVRRARPPARHRPEHAVRTFVQPVALVRRIVRRVQRGRAVLRIERRRQLIFAAPGIARFVHRIRRLGRPKVLSMRPRLRALFVVPGAIFHFARRMKRPARIQRRPISQRRRVVSAVAFRVRGRIRLLVRRISPLALRSRSRLRAFSPKVPPWVRLRPSRVKHQVNVWIRRWRRLRIFPRPLIDQDTPRVIIYATLDAAVVMSATLDQPLVIMMNATLDAAVEIDATLGEI